MAEAERISNAAANAAVDAVTGLINSGKLLIYDGVQPETADTEVDGQVLLAELTLNEVAFAPAEDGVAVANAITGDIQANATGTATWFRVLTSADAKMFDGSVGTADCDLNLNSVAIQENAAVNVTALTYTQPKAAPPA